MAAVRRLGTYRDEWNAWCEMAMTFDMKARHPSYNFKFDEWTGLILGMCKGTDDWYTMHLGDILKARLNKHLPARVADYLLCSRYWWGLNSSGWRMRSDFCWRMAEECEREMNK